MTLERIILSLRLLAALFVVLAAAWWTRSPRISADDTVPMPAVIPVDAATAGSPIAEVDTSVVDAIVTANVFSPTRRPPATRYQLPREAVVGEEIAPSLPEPSPATAFDGAMANVPAERVPALYGTLRSTEGLFALLRLDARASAPQLYQVGDRAGGFRVLRIDEQAVTLSGSSGPITLRLAKPGKDVP